MRTITRLVVAASLVAALFGMGGVGSPANAGPGCTDQVIVLPSLNPSYPGVNINICINQLGINAEVGAVPGVDLVNLFAGTQAMTICVYSPTFNCLATNTGPTGVGIDPSTPIFAGPLKPAPGVFCVGSPGTCLTLFLSGGDGSITVYNQGAVVITIPLNTICVRFDNPTPC